MGAEIPSLMPTRLGYSIRGLANWILDYADELRIPISNMAINKLAFFAFEFLLLERGKILTDAKIEAWEHGPVFREVYQSFKHWGDRPIKSRAEFYSVESGMVEIVRQDLDDSTSVFLRDRLRPMLSLSASVLREISHQSGGAWDKVWRYKGHANPGMEITIDHIISSSGPERVTCE
jgi:uncharacterized phage-associated protein